MADVFDPEQRSAVMRAVKSTGTTPEIRVRRAATALGLRYRLHRADLPGKPDLAFPGRRIALFVHGCFWHGHDCARGARTPVTNVEYWTAKIARNIARDKRNIADLKALDWRPVVIWECETRDPEALANLLRKRLKLPDTKGANSRALTPRR